MGACRWSHANMRLGTLPPMHAGRHANSSTALHGAGRLVIPSSGHLVFPSDWPAARRSYCRDAGLASLQTVARSKLHPVKHSDQRAGKRSNMQPATRFSLRLVGQANSPSVLRSNRQPVRHANSQTGGPPDCSESERGETLDMLRRSNRRLQSP